MAFAFPGVGSAKATYHLEHTIEFESHPAPLPVQVRTYAACDHLTPICGFGSVSGPPAPPNPAQTMDIKVNGLSILTSPVLVGLAPSGTPVPISFIPGAAVPQNAKLDYCFTDGGAPAEYPSIIVQWLKQIGRIEPV